MTLVYDLIKTANQMFNTTIGENNVELRFRSFRELTYVSIYINGELVQGGAVAKPNKPIFNEKVNQLVGGEFRFTTSSDDYPYYTSFGESTCELVFISSEEV